MKQGSMPMVGALALMALLVGAAPSTAGNADNDFSTDKVRQRKETIRYQGSRKARHIAAKQDGMNNRDDRDMDRQGMDDRDMDGPDRMRDDDRTQPVARIIPGQPVRESDVQAVIANWPMKPKDQANEMMAKYGMPDLIEADHITWKNEGPFAKIMVHKEQVDHAWPMAHTDFLHHAVYLEVPEDKVDDLAMFDGSVWVERTEGLLNAKCDLEVNNIIALNVAYDVAMGKRTVEDARAFFTQTAMDAKNGKLNDYSRGLIFEPQSKAAAHYPDSPQM